MTKNIFFLPGDQASTAAKISPDASGSLAMNSKQFYLDRESTIKMIFYNRSKSLAICVGFLDNGPLISAL